MITGMHDRYDTLRNCSLIELRQLYDNGDPVAMIVLAEHYLRSDNIFEQKEGIKLLDTAEKVLRNQNAFDDFEGTRKAMVYLYCLKGDAYESQYRRPGEHTPDKNALGNEIFKSYSKAYELDSTKVDGLIRCYSSGIGVPRDEAKVLELWDKKASMGGIEDK